MSPEGQKPSENIIPLFAIIGTVVLLSQWAFSRNVRQQILNRDKVDVWTGETDKLEAAHITHDKQDPLYNDTSNGRMLTTKHHYLDHLNRAGRNGLSIAGNDAALRLIWKRLSESERQGLPEPPQEEQGW